MVRVILAVVLGGVIHFLWGWASWDLLGLHNATLGEFKDQEAVLSVLEQNASDEKAYVFPAWSGYSEGAKANETQQKMWEAKHKSGPIGVVMFNDGGKEPGGPTTMLTGLVLELVSACFVVFILVLSLGSQQTFLKRVFVVMVMGLFAAVTRDLLFWNWMNYPFHYSVVNAADTVLGWTAAGLVIAALVKPDAPKPTALR